MERWECWVVDWLNALEVGNGLSGRAVDMIDTLEIEDGGTAEEQKFCELLRQAQESLWQGDFERALALGLTAAKVHVEAWTPPPWKKPDIEQLKRDGVSDEQICWILGWKDENGNPDLKKLQEERRHPGLHLDNWQSPIVKEFAERKASVLQRIESLRRRFRVRFVDEVVVIPVPGVSRNTWELLQTFGNLQRLGWSVRKIARHLGLSYAKTLKLRNQWKEIYGQASQSGTGGAGGGALAEGVVGEPDCQADGLPGEDDFQVGEEAPGEMEPGDFDFTCRDRGGTEAIEGGGVESGA